MQEEKRASEEGERRSIYSNRRSFMENGEREWGRRRVEVRGKAGRR